MRVLVCGGRDYKDWGKVQETLDGLMATEGISEVISGCAKGADTMALDWALLNKVESDKYPAKWGLYGRKKAGPMRNQQMLDEGQPDLVVAFPGDQARQI